MRNTPSSQPVAAAMGEDPSETLIVGSAFAYNRPIVD